MNRHPNICVEINMLVIQRIRLPIYLACRAYSKICIYIKVIGLIGNLCHSLFISLGQSSS